MPDPQPGLEQPGPRAVRTEKTEPEQLVLDGLPDPAAATTGSSRARRRARVQDVEPASELPVARVCVDLPPPHLDRPFEYLVPANLDGSAVPGTRVKVRFGRQDVDGYILGRAQDAEHEGTLAPLRRVVSAEPVLTPEVARLARAVADRYAGTLADVLRLAVPPRHARTENDVPPAADGPAAPRAGADPVVGGSAWEGYRGGPAFLSRLAAGASPRAAWSALPAGPGRRWPDAVAQATVACLAGGRGVLVVVPDARDVERVCTALDAAGVPAWEPGHVVAEAQPPAHVRLMADEGPSRRYRAFLAALRGHARVVVGTRAAAFAPVHDLGLVVCWDDGDDLHAEPRSPYPHVREVLSLRAQLEGCALLLAAHSRSVEVQAMVGSGWVREIAADRAVVRARAPRVRALTSVELAREGAAAAARLPGEAWRTMRDRLAEGPVLVQVPRAGYLPAVACVRCRTVARCQTCHGPLALRAADAVPECGWCGRLATRWKCGTCGASGLRSVQVGSDRTAEELGRAFPGVTVRSSGARAAAGVLATVPDRPALVVATPGAEPVAPSGYAAAVLLDAAVSTGSTSLRAAEDALRRWLAAAALVRDGAAGGVVLLVGDAAERPTQALVRWDPAGMAERELAERHELLLPPAVRVAELTGTREAVAAFVARLELPDGGEVLGPVSAPQDDRAGATGAGGAPVTLDPPVRTLVRVPAGAGHVLERTVAASAVQRSARREGGALRVRMDPSEMW